LGSAVADGIQKLRWNEASELNEPNAVVRSRVVQERSSGAIRASEALPLIPRGVHPGRSCSAAGLHPVVSTSLGTGGNNFYSGAKEESGQKAESKVLWATVGQRVNV
jgi:hypothetical protein